MLGDLGVGSGTFIWAETLFLGDLSGRVRKSQNRCVGSRITNYMLLRVSTMYKSKGSRVGCCGSNKSRGSQSERETVDRHSTKPTILQLLVTAKREREMSRMDFGLHFIFRISIRILTVRRAPCFQCQYAVTILWQNDDDGCTTMIK